MHSYVLYGLCHTEMGEKAIFLSICLWLPVTASGIIPLQTRMGTTSTLPLSKMTVSMTTVSMTTVTLSVPATATKALTVVTLHQFHHDMKTSLRILNVTVLYKLTSA